MSIFKRFDKTNWLLFTFFLNLKIDFGIPENRNSAGKIAYLRVFFNRFRWFLKQNDRTIMLHKAGMVLHFVTARGVGVTRRVTPVAECQYEAGYSSQRTIS